MLRGGVCGAEADTSLPSHFSNAKSKMPTHQALCSCKCHKGDLQEHLRTLEVHDTTESLAQSNMKQRATVA
jgi:hypothetical protein